jgi:hypothetical protein
MADAAERVRRITFELDQDRRDASARRVMTGSQGFLLGLAVYVSATGLVLWPFVAFTVLHIVLTLFFSGGILLRLVRALDVRLPAEPYVCLRTAGRDPAAGLYSAHCLA